MVLNVAGTVGRATVLLMALALTPSAFAMGKGGGGGKPPKNDLMGEAAMVVSAGRNGLSETQVFDINLNGPQVVVKLNKDESFGDPTWAPDGLHIALDTNDLLGCRDSVRVTTFDDFSGEWSIPVMIVCARSTSELDWDPSSVGTSQRIYFRADPFPDDGFFQRALAFVDFSLDMDGNLVGEANLIFPNGTDDDNVWTLAVSPDGYTIAVTRIELGPDEDGTEIALFEDGLYTTLLEVVGAGPNEETFWPNHIAWHPSGNYLTVSLSTDLLGSKIHCVDLSGNATVATDAIAAGFNRQDSNPTWSPDGSEFFFERDRAIARITFVEPPLNCDDFVEAVGFSEEDKVFEFLLQAGGKITRYSNPSVRLP